MPKFAPLLSLLLIAGCVTPALAGKTQNVVLIVSDGLRWQEIFQGADPLLLDTRNGGSWVEDGELKRRYWRNTPQERRELLLPFIWGTVAKRGQVFGNRTQGSDAHVTNGLAFSYPGYNEMSVGFPNPAITSNEFGPNPNASVFEWLNKSPDLSGRVAVYGYAAARRAHEHCPRNAGADCGHGCGVDGQGLSEGRSSGCTANRRYVEGPMSSRVAPMPSGARSATHGDIAAHFGSHLEG